MTNPTPWAVQPAAWAKLDSEGCVYCADIDTAYSIARQLHPREGDQVIWKITHGEPIKWVRVSDAEVVQSA